jgi:hypothetical protein
VGNQAPDFTAEAVFDQEFINVSLSEYQYATHQNDFTAAIYH